MARGPSGPRHVKSNRLLFINLMRQSSAPLIGRAPYQAPSIEEPVHPMMLIDANHRAGGVAHSRTMSMTIPVAHDFICPWCWAGLLQAKRLKEEFGVQLDWLAYELFPDEIEWSNSAPAVAAPANKPKTLSRFEFLLAADQMKMPSVDRPRRMRTHNSHEAVEFVKAHQLDDADRWVEILYRAYWEQGLEINDPKVLKKLAKGTIHDVDKMLASIEKRKYRKHIVGFDDPAYANGVYNVPTFFIGSERYAEQPYTTLAAAVQEMGHHVGTDVYAALHFPPAPVDRPYVFTNMVTTIDGRSVNGERGEDISDLGSKIDHSLMRRTEEAADAVMIGAGTLRATSPTWAPHASTRIVVSNSGDLNYESKYFSTAGRAFVACSGSATVKLAKGVKLLRAGNEKLDFVALLRRLREMGIERLLVLGGSSLNGALLERDLVDEMFLTIAPKVKLGKDLPNYAEGMPLPRNALPEFFVVEHHRLGEEIFLRYRRRK